MTLIEAKQKHGARKAAIMLLSTVLNRNFGISYEDLPDTAERCDTVDTLEELIEADPEKNKEQISELVREATSYENIVGGGALFD